MNNATNPQEVTVKVGDTVRLRREVRVTYGPGKPDDVIQANCLGVVSYLPDPDDEDCGWVGVTWSGGLGVEVREDEVELVQIAGA